MTAEITPDSMAEVHSQQQHIAYNLNSIAGAVVRLADHSDRLTRLLDANRSDGPTPLEAAMHSVWLHGRWKWVTSKMTTEEREAAADAVQQYSDWLNRQDDEISANVLDLRWWRQ